jgi:hypothetical protein
VLFEPVVIAPPEKYPTAVLLPLVHKLRAFAPMAVLLAPVEFVKRAPAPIPVLEEFVFA